MQAAGAGRDRHPLAGIGRDSVADQPEGVIFAAGVFGDGGGDGYGTLEQATVAALPSGVAGAGVEGDEHITSGGRLKDAGFQFAMPGGGFPVDALQGVGGQVIAEADETAGVVLYKSASATSSERTFPDGQHTTQVHDSRIDEQIFNIRDVLLGGGEAEHIAAAQAGRADTVVAAGAATHPVAPGDSLVRQQGSSDTVVEFGFGANAAAVGSAGLQA